MAGSRALIVVAGESWDDGTDMGLLTGKGIMLECCGMDLVEFIMEGLYVGL